MKSDFTIRSVFSLLLLCGATIGASAQEATGPKVIAADPASGTKVTSLSEIVITMDQETEDAVNEWEVENVELPPVFGATSDVTATLWYPVGDMTKLRITITPTITADGTYEITIPAGYISNKDWESNPETKLIYTIGSGTSGEEPVQYDMNYTSIDPEPGTFDSLNTITLTFDSEVFTDPEARAFLYKDNMVYKGVRMAVRDGNKVDLLFEDFDTEGTYELVIDKAQIGDAKWLESHHLGHANPEFKIPGYKIKQTVSKLTYDFIPVLTPDGSEAVGILDRISLRFPGSWCSASDDQIVILDYKEDQYPLMVSLGESLDEAILTLDSPLREAGQYKLVIPKGRFGNSDYEETDGEEGALNPEISLIYDVNPQGSASEIEADRIAVCANGRDLILNGNGIVSVYNVQGILSARTEVNGSTSITLIPGTYIVNTGVRNIKILIK